MPDERRATPGFCVAYQSSDGDIDGLHDRPWTKEGARTLREAEMAESTRRLAELGPGVKEAKEEVEVSLGLGESRPEGTQPGAALKADATLLAQESTGAEEEAPTPQATGGSTPEPKTSQEPVQS